MAKSAEDWKAAGNKLVGSKSYAEALEPYTNGLKVDPDHHLILSNRALCFHKLGRLEEALTDAMRCTTLKPDFVKGFLRSAMVLRDLKRPQEALELLRKAPADNEVGTLVEEVKPEAAAFEKRRLSQLGGPEKKKEEANALFKKGLFEQALVVYDEALKLCKDPAEELALTIRNNRAACYHQLSNFPAVVEDSSFVLEHDPENQKALIRRMIAFEPLEKYERALDDARLVLKLIPGHDVANKVQHRLSKIVRDRARENGA